MAQRVKKPALRVPTSSEEANQFLAEIRAEQRTISTVKNNLNADVDSLKKAADERVSVAEKRIDELLDGLRAFGEAHYDELTENGRRRSVSLPNGVFGWRTTPLAVHISNVKKVLAELKRRKLTRFIRIREEPNKDAMLMDREAAEKVPGITIGNKEEFYAKPNEIEVEVSKKLPKKKK